MEDNKLEIWCAAVKDARRKCEVAKKEYEDAATVRLERKHKLEELTCEFNQLVDDGAYKEPVKDPQMRLFDDAELDSEEEEDEDDEEGLIDELEVPVKIIVTLKKHGVETMEDLGEIIDGENTSFPNGLSDMADLDVDARNRVAAAFRDTRSLIAAEDGKTVYSPPLPVSVQLTPENVTTGVVRIKLKIDLEDIGLKAGNEVEATPTETGEMLVVLGDEDDERFLLQSGEYALA